MPDSTFGDPGLTTFCRLDELGLYATGQFLEPDQAMIACRVLDPGDECNRCQRRGAPRDTVTRILEHEPLGWRPTLLLVTIRRYRCGSCGRVWRQDTSKAAEPRARLSRCGLRWALEGLVVGHLSMARIAVALGVSWNTANSAVLAEGRRVLIDDPDRFNGVQVIGVDEHVWRHTRRGDKYVTVIIDVTPVQAGTGPARLLDMVEGRSKTAFAGWLAARDQQWRDQVQVRGDGRLHRLQNRSHGTAPGRRRGDGPIPRRPVGRRRPGRVPPPRPTSLHGHRGHAGDPLYKARRTLHTGEDLLTDKQKARIDALFADENHLQVQVTWAIYQRMIAACSDPDRAAGRTRIRTLIDSLTRGVPAVLVEIRRLGRTLNRRAPDILAFFDRPGTSNGPTKAINGRLEHLRGIALGFRNLTNYVARSLLEVGGFKTGLHLRLR